MAIINKSQWGTISSLIDNESKLSYTEKEYDYAISNNKVVLSFLLDESFVTEKYKNLRKLNKFREKVKNNKKMLRKCKDKNNLSAHIINALKDEYNKNPQND